MSLFTPIVRLNLSLLFLILSNNFLSAQTFCNEEIFEPSNSIVYDSIPYGTGIDLYGNTEILYCRITIPNPMNGEIKGTAIFIQGSEFSFEDGKWQFGLNTINGAIEKQFLQKNMAFVSPLNIRIGFPIKKTFFFCFDESIPFIAPLPRDEFGLQRSLWMGAQDITKLFNFIEEEGRLYGIDKTKPFYAGGSSGGGSSLLYSVFADLESERPIATFDQGIAVECDYEIEMPDLGPMPEIRPAIAGVFICNSALDVDIISYDIFKNQAIPLVLFGQKWDPAIPASIEPQRIFHLFGLPLPNTFPYSYGPNGLSEILSAQDYDHLVIERNDFLSHSTGYVPSLMEEIFNYFCENEGDRIGEKSFRQTSRTATDLLNNYDINIGPNPTSGLININLNNYLNKEFSVSIFNAIGDLVLSEKHYDSNTLTFHLDYQNKGIYFVQIRTEFGELVKTEKIIFD